MMGKKLLVAGGALVALAASSIPAAASDYWWTNTTISGRDYWDITNISHKRNGVAQTDEGTSFDIKRFYISIDHTFDDMFSADVTTDVTYVSGESLTQVYLKKAYLQAKISDALIIRVGSTDLPWIPFVEDVYGYRYVENTLIDRTKYGTSADWGLHVMGKLADGLIGYQFSAVNGAGYKNPRRTGSVDLEGRVNLKYDDFVLAVGGYSGKLGPAHGTTTYHTATRFDALAAYTSKQIRVGVEYYSANDWMSVTAFPKRTDKADGVSAFASFQFDPQWAVFGRYDWVMPKSSSAALFGTSAANKSMKDSYFNVGVTWSPAKIVDISLVYKHEKGGGGFISTSNGTIGGLGAGTSGTYDEVGIWGQFRW
jgi:hypothetical protein